MKVLVLSDMSWGYNRDFDASTISNESPFYSAELQKYIDIIQKCNPDLILFAGDVIEVRKYGIFSFYSLLSYLEGRNIHSFYIFGNHDIQNDYEEFEKMASKLTYTKNISDERASFNGLNILGISFVTTSSKTDVNKLIEENKSFEFDIILSHSELKRRPFLFNFNTKIIITGHFDKKLFKLNDKIFISIDNDDLCRVDYVLIDYPSSVRYLHYMDWGLSYEYKLTGVNVKDSMPHEEFKINDSLADINLHEALDLSILDLYKKPKHPLFIEGIPLFDHFTFQYIRGKNYKNLLEILFAIKERKIDKKEFNFSEIIGQDFSEGYVITKAMIIDFIGKIN